MISETTRSRNPAGHAGLLENLLALASALTEFFEGRFALFAQESKAAFVQLLVLAACLGPTGLAEFVGDDDNATRLPSY